MITIEEKLKLFTKIVYDKVDKENQIVVENFNREHSNVVEQKKQEFIKEANAMSQQSQKSIEKEKLHIGSNARTEAKKIIMEKRMEIFEETIQELINYAKTFTETEEYKEMFFRDFRNAFLEMDKDSNIDVYLTQRDLLRFKEEVLSILKGKAVEFRCDEEITGGFILLDVSRNIKIDMSLLNRIQISKDYIGQKLFEVL